MSAPALRFVEVGGERCRVLEKGQGEPLGFLAGLGGLARFGPCLERLAEHRRVIVPSIPGFPGATGHQHLDDLPDWIAATLDLLERAGLAGADLAGVSVGATLLAEAAIFSPGLARRLVLAAPFGLFVESEPTGDPWGQMPGDLSLLSSRPAELAASLAAPEGVEPTEWQVIGTRASEAAARLLWPTGDTGIRKRLHRIGCPTLLVWGGADRVVPPSYAKRFAEAITGKTAIREIPGAGHLVDHDAPEETARAILDFLR
jgi:pimeloyl-ACP methyl ester carboxylesterase